MLQLISTIKIYKKENPSMQSVKDRLNVRGNLFVSMVTVSAQQMIPVGIITNVSLVSTNKSTTI
jgi:hypothetical protein